MPSPKVRSTADRFRFAAILVAVVAFYGLCLHFAQIDPSKLWTGLPRLANWAVRAFPPDFSEINIFVQRAAETVAMGTIGTTLGVVIAAPMCVLAARNTAPSSWNLLSGPLAS